MPGGVYEMARHGNVLCLVMWLVLASGDPLRSGVRRTQEDDPRHLYESRPRGSEHWSPDLAKDFVLLQYDRGRGDILGYQRSSGKVFAQHSVTDPKRLTEALTQSDGVIIGMRSDTGKLGLNLHHSACEVMGVDVDTGVPSWREARSAGTEVHTHSSKLRMLSTDPPWHLTWKAYSPSVTGTRPVVLSSTGDHGLSCECAWEQTRGIWRPVKGASVSRKCTPVRRPVHDHEHTGPEAELRHEPQGPAALRPLLRMRAERFCRELQAQLHDRTLLIIPAADLVGVDASAHGCWSAASRYFGKQHLPDSMSFGPQRVRLPRSQVLSDIKFGMQTLTLIQSLVAAISLDIETEASMSAYAAASNLAWSARLYLPAGTPTNRTLHPALHSQLHNLAQVVNQSKDVRTPLPVSIPRVCDPDLGNIRHFDLLAALLASRTASLTPESANTTLLGQAFASFSLESVECLYKAIDAYHAFVQCTTDAGTGASTYRDDSKYSKVLREMRMLTGMRPKKYLSDDFTPMDRSDQAVQKTLQALEELVLTVRLLGDSYVTSVRVRHAHRNTTKTHNTFATASPGSLTYAQRWLQFIQSTRAWCCATHPPMHLLSMQPKGCTSLSEREWWRLYEYV